MHHDQDIRNMGGLRKYMPITWITSLLGSLALIGTPFFAGFYSKDTSSRRCTRAICRAPASPTSRSLAGVFVTAFYSFRMYFLVFHGQERFHDKPFPRSRRPRRTHARPRRTRPRRMPHACAARIALGRDAAAGPAGDPVGGDRLHDDRPDAVRRLLQGLDRRRRRRAPGDGGAGRGVPRRRSRWRCTR